jgi:hypothetical protein
MSKTVPELLETRNDQIKSAAKVDVHESPQDKLRVVNRKKNAALGTSNTNIAKGWGMRQFRFSSNIDLAFPLK